MPPTPQGPPEASSPEARDDQQAAPSTPAHHMFRGSRRMRYSLIVIVLLLLFSPVLLSLSGSLQTLAQTLLGGFVEEPVLPLIEVEEVKPLPPPRPAPRDLTFADDPLHPDRLFGPYFGDASSSSDTTTARLIP
ncbi:MAG: hypothetical protein ACE10K_01080, partial [Rhodothermales bacterium]